MIGTILIILPLLIAVVLLIITHNDTYSEWRVVGSLFMIIFAITALTALAVYIKTSTYSVERESIQNTINDAREFGTQYEVATVTRDAIEFNKKLALDRDFWHPHFKLWINDDILEIEPIK